MKEMPTDKALQNIDIATLIVSFAQVIGLIVIIVAEGPVVTVVIGIAEFAAVVKYFLPAPGVAPWLRKGSAICGVFLIIFAIVSVIR